MQRRVSLPFRHLGCGTLKGEDASRDVGHALGSLEKAAGLSLEVREQGSKKSGDVGTVSWHHAQHK